jgi:hypothetical protein
MSEFVEINPDAGRYAYLEEAGEYGPGLEFEADVSVSHYELPASEPPPYIKGSKAQDFAFFRFEVRRQGVPAVRLRHWEPIGPFSGSKLGTFLVNLGVDVEDPEGRVRHDANQVPGRKCGIRVGAPRENYSGRIYDVMGV